MTAARTTWAGRSAEIALDRPVGPNGDDEEPSLHTEISTIRGVEEVTIHEDRIVLVVASVHYCNSVGEIAVFILCRRGYLEPQRWSQPV